MKLRVPCDVVRRRGFCQANGRNTPQDPRIAKHAFTLLEVMIAIFVFGLVLMAIYSTWLAILKGSRAGMNAAAAVQRSRIAVRTLEDALLTVQMYNANVKQYYFVADTSGDFAALSLVSRLPESFPGVGRYGDQVVRRVSFYTQPGKDGGTELLMTQAPMLLRTNASVEPYSIVLAKEVSLFRLEFYDAQKDEWLDEWRYTNQLPRVVQVALGLGKAQGRSSDPQDVVTRIISIPSVAVTADIQGAGVPPVAPGLPGDPGLRDPKTGQPLPGQPGYTPPGYGQPGFGQPGFGQPGFGQPGFGQPGFGQPGFGQPGFGQPGFTQPGVIQPGFGQPRFGQPGYGQPGYGQPGYGQPGLPNRR
jgi:prepilin-type N-terminal cleavage/methylation domain-containing protein